MIGYEPEELYQDIIAQMEIEDDEREEGEESQVANFQDFLRGHGLTAPMMQAILGIVDVRIVYAPFPTGDQNWLHDPYYIQLVFYIRRLSRSSWFATSRVTASTSSDSRLCRCSYPYGSHTRSSHTFKDHRLLDIPYLCGEQYRDLAYDREGFKGFPRRKGLDPELLISGNFQG